MQRLFSKATLACGIVAVSLGAFTSPVAAATTASASYGGQCGSGFGVVNQFDLPDNRGTVFLTYNASVAKNCVVTIRTNPGATTLMEAALKRSSSSEWKVDSDDYTTYAGPVKVSAGGQCVDWGGTIGTATDWRTGTNCG